jgi:hypothetical protein
MAQQRRGGFMVDDEEVEAFSHDEPFLAPQQIRVDRGVVENLVFDHLRELGLDVPDGSLWLYQMDEEGSYLGMLIVKPPEAKA